MQVRFTCPACNQSHVVSIPDKSVVLTCSETHRMIEVRLAAGCEVKPRLLEGSQKGSK